MRETIAMSQSVAPSMLQSWRMTQSLDFDRIPVIDMAAFLDGSDRQGVADRIGQACRNVGFLYLTNHGIPAALVDAAMAQSRRFFALPDARKMAIHIARSPAHRGYFPFFGENNDPKNARDLKEGFDLARDLPADDPRVLAGKALHGPNVWPADLPGFRETIEQYYAALMALAGQLMQAFALSLHLPQSYFEPMLDEAMGALRLLHYPPQPATDDASIVGTGSHTDYGCLTILAQDAVGGLQVQNAARQWVAAPPVPGAFVVNIGDQMARWTNDVFAATHHRVINTSGRERYSMPFFFEPNFDAVISCLETCRAPGHPAKYDDVVAGEYLVSRFNETFSYRVAETV
jgi:isopenicillin N synthase-like dioxygenase